MNKKEKIRIAAKTAIEEAIKLKRKTEKEHIHRTVRLFAQYVMALLYGGLLFYFQIAIIIGTVFTINGFNTSQPKYLLLMLMTSVVLTMINISFWMMLIDKTFEKGGDKKWQ